eukprot:PhM_4_TR17766/c0_g1_i1/m.836
MQDAFLQDVEEQREYVVAVHGVEAARLRALDPVLQQVVTHCRHSEVLLPQLKALRTVHRRRRRRALDHALEEGRRRRHRGGVVGAAHVPQRGCHLNRSGAADDDCLVVAAITEHCAVGQTSAVLEIVTGCIRGEVYCEHRDVVDVECALVAVELNELEHRKGVHDIEAGVEQGNGVATGPVPHNCNDRTFDGWRGRQLHDARQRRLQSVEHLDLTRVGVEENVLLNCCLERRAGGVAVVHTFVVVWVPNVVCLWQERRRRRDGVLAGLLGDEVRVQRLLRQVGLERLQLRVVLVVVLPLLRKVVPNLLVDLRRDPLLALGVELLRRAHVLLRDVADDGVAVLFADLGVGDERRQRALRGGQDGLLRGVVLPLFSLLELLLLKLHLDGDDGALHRVLGVVAI